jgi:hypothetical protein
MPHQRLDGEKHGSNVKSRRPIFLPQKLETTHETKRKLDNFSARRNTRKQQLNLENIEADAAEFVDVWMIYLS